ncbi:MAG TPA: arginine--tRNA ligase [Vicinamibacterales bacterium]|nr:arginine--tRNA ligase [Vicinamibacterales bacterium]
MHDRIRSRIREALREAFGLAAAELPAIVIEMPPNRALGDLGVPVAFELARRLKRAPRHIASDLSEKLGPIEGVSRVQPAPNGYLNFFLDRSTFLRSRLAPEPAPRARPALGKIIVEHTAINPNKAAHIGHLRNAALGDTLVRALRFLGHSVEVQNYIDDTGVQVADVVVGFTALEGLGLADVRALADKPKGRFDYYCWDLYARVTEWYEADKTRLEKRAEALHALEEGHNPLAEMGALIADRIVRTHLRTMARINVGYDLLTWEGDILRLHFWSTAFDQLKSRNAVFLQTEGRLKGCWVMPIEDAQTKEDAPDVAAAATETEIDDEETEQREKVIVRSNGTVTYVGKDIANQCWKFGLLGRDFYYRVFEDTDNHPLWATTSNESENRAHPEFGRASGVYNVIDSRQAYLQQLLKQALATMGFKEQADQSTHYSYEMVALTHSTARALGYDDADSAGKPFVEVSGRKGLGVKADDLLDRLAETAHGEVTRRNPELSDEDRKRIAQTIATAAVRYFLVKFGRGKVIAFDIDEALSFEGETGPYLQYAVVRANNIFAKLGERDGLTEAGVLAQLDSVGRDALESGAEADELWGLVLEAARLDEVVEAAVRSLELSVLAKYAFGLAQAFNAFYHRQQILREERTDARLWRAAGVAYLRRQLTSALDLMGCGVPVRM